MLVRRIPIPMASVGCVFLAAAVTLSGMGISSCSSPGAADGTVTIAVALLPSERAAYARLLEDFTSSSGVKIELVAQQYQQIREALRAEAAAGSGQLDIVEFDVYFLADVSTLVRPLDSLMTTIGEVRESVAKEVWQAGVNPRARDQLLFVPHRLNWQAMIYNAARLPEAPRTWEDLRLLARAQPSSIGIKGARYEGLSCDFFPFLWQAGGDPLAPQSSAALEAMTFFAELRSGIHPGSVSFRENTLLQAQEHEEVLLHFNWPFVVPLLREKGLLPGKIQTAPLPVGPAGSATVLGGGYLGIPLTAPHPESAARLLEFLTSDQTERRLLTELGWFPPRRGAWDALDEETRQAARGFIEMKDQVRARPSIRDYDRISALWQTAITQVLFEGVEPKTALIDLTRKMRQQLEASSQGGE